MQTKRNLYHIKTLIKNVFLLNSLHESLMSFWMSLKKPTQFWVQNVCRCTYPFDTNTHIPSAEDISVSSVFVFRSLVSPTWPVKINKTHKNIFSFELLFLLLTLNISNEIHTWRMCHFFLVASMTVLKLGHFAPNTPNLYLHGLVTKATVGAVSF